MVERAVHILPEEDRDTAQCLHDELEETGVDILTSAAVKQLDSSSRKVVVENNQGERCEIQSDLCLVAIGRNPQLGELNLDQVGIDFDRNGIYVNEHMQTNHPHIYACGDVTGGVQLAHATELIGQAAVMMHTELTADTLEQFIAAHPTLSEAIHEALLQTIGRAVHC